MNKTSLLELAKKLNIPRRNCMKTKEELEKAIKDTIAGYKEIIFGADSPVYMVCLDELQKAASHRSKSVRAEFDG